MAVTIKQGQTESKARYILLETRLNTLEKSVDVENSGKLAEECSKLREDIAIAKQDAKTRHDELLEDLVKYETECSQKIKQLESDLMKLCSERTDEQQQKI